MMPFFYQLPMPNLGINNNGTNPIVLTKHLVRNGAWVEESTPVATVESAGLTYEILMAGPGILHKFLCDENSVIQNGDSIAEIHADGESIPYNKPYSKIRRIEVAS